MKYKYLLILVSFVFVGCASLPPQQEVELNAAALKVESPTVAFVFQEIPQPSLHYPGASCLLCLAAASAANGKLYGHIKTLSIDELLSIEASVQKTFEQANINIKKVEPKKSFSKLKKIKFDEAKPLVARRDFSVLKSEFGADKLLNITIRPNIYRPYASYVPTSPPKVSFVVKLEMVNLENNTYEMFQSTIIELPVEGEWKEPPSFPGVTNTYYRATALVQEYVEKTIASLSDK